MSPAEPLGRGVLVIGKHRSGTSAVTRVLNLLGLPLCRSEDLLPHRNGNPTGHWESATLMAFNERLLAALGARWNRLPAVTGPLARWHALAGFAPVARATFQHAHPSTTWVWKDPRLCLLVPFWRTVLACDPPVVLMIRNPDEIATSLHTRDCVDRVTSLRLWQDSTEHALLGCAGAPLIVVRHPDLLADPACTSQRRVEFLTDEGIAVQHATTRCGTSQRSIVVPFEASPDVPGDLEIWIGDDGVPRVQTVVRMTARQAAAEERRLQDPATMVLVCERNRAWSL